MASKVGERLASIKGNSKVGRALRWHMGFGSLRFGASELIQVYRKVLWDGAVLVDFRPGVVEGVVLWNSGLIRVQRALIQVGETYLRLMVSNSLDYSLTHFEFSQTLESAPWAHVHFVLKGSPTELESEFFLANAEGESEFSLTADLFDQNDHLLARVDLVFLGKRKGFVGLGRSHVDSAQEENQVWK